MSTYNVFLTATAIVGVDADDREQAERLVAEAIAADRLYSYIFDPKKAEVADVQRRVDPDTYVYPAND